MNLHAKRYTEICLIMTSKIKKFKKKKTTKTPLFFKLRHSTFIDNIEQTV